jgi:hypothetical protein
MVVDDGDGGLECWCDADPASYRLLVSRGRCPGGTNAKTGKIHRVIGLTATVAGAILYVVLGVRFGIIDFSGPPRGRLASFYQE